MRVIMILCLVLSMEPFSLPLCAGTSTASDSLNAIEKGFLEPPSTARPMVFWHWINGNVTKKGITDDLEDMKRAGIGGVHLFDVSIYLPEGPLRFGTEAWYEHIRYAVKECERLGLEFNMMNCAGWATSGGPWITPELSMKELVWSETEATGPGRFQGSLPRGEVRQDFYRDIAVVAVPSDAPGEAWMRSQLREIRSANKPLALNDLIDNDISTVVEFPPTGLEDPLCIEFSFKNNVNLRLLTVDLMTRSSRLVFKGSIEVDRGGGRYKRIRDFDYRGNSSMPSAITIPFDSVSGTDFRIWFACTSNGQPVACRFGEIQFSDQYRIENYDSKILRNAATIHRSVSSPCKDDERAVPESKVLDLTDRMSSDGRLEWNIPEGRWTVLRFGYTTNGRTNHPAQPEGRGLEADKLDRRAVEAHFEQMLGRIIRESGPSAGKALRGLIVDSFEAGFQNWTESLPDEFHRRNGYRMRRFLPVLTGRVVDSMAVSECFLWDFRQTVGRLLAEHYYGTLRDLAHQHGMIFYAEPYDSMVSPFQCGEYVDVPTAEFWLHPKNNVKTIASISHTYGQPLTAAEAFTALPEDGAWRTYPYALKALGDRAFAEGMNRAILHSYVHQPYDNAAPGFTLGRYGSRFGRFNTWWRDGSAWIDYLSRCQFLLQQGKPVTDICLLYYDDIEGTVSFELPAFGGGYDYDICAPKQFLKMNCTNGVCRLPNGQEYRLILLPEHPFMTYDLLRHLHEMIQSGALVSGPPPAGPSGLNDYRRRNKEFSDLAASLWGGMDGKTRTSKKLGKGTLYWGMPVDQILAANGIRPDFQFQGSGPESEIRYIHRRAGRDEIYFVSNQGDNPVSLTGQFRVENKTPEFWDADLAKRWDARVFRAMKDYTEVPFKLDPRGSVFVIFRKPLPDKWIVSIDPGPAEIFNEDCIGDGEHRYTVAYSDGSQKSLLREHAASIEISGPWKVRFLDGRGAPAEINMDMLIPWNEHPNDNIKYYSGTAEYENTYIMPKEIDIKDRFCIIDLGDLGDIAEIYINDLKVGVVWKKPYRIDITEYIRPGVNTVRIRVTNRWVNRLIGDEAIPIDYTYRSIGKGFTDGALEALPEWLGNPSVRGNRQRHTFSTWKHYSAGDPLVKSGLIGPVQMISFGRLRGGEND
jgi:hypothetical protein